MDRQKPSRIIKGLLRSSLTQSPPAFFLKNSRLKGCRAKGKTYERKVLKDFSRLGLGKCYLGPWFYFTDENGTGFCQPDLLIEFDTWVLIIEVKLTQTSDAWDQLRLLYKPVVEMALGKPCYTLQVCKHLRWENTARVPDLQTFTERPRPGLWTLHYLA